MSNPDGINVGINMQGNSTPHEDIINNAQDPSVTSIPDPALAYQENSLAMREASRAEAILRKQQIAEQRQLNSAIRHAKAQEYAANYSPPEANYQDPYRNISSDSEAYQSNISSLLERRRIGDILAHEQKLQERDEFFKNLSFDDAPEWSDTYTGRRDVSSGMPKQSGYTPLQPGVFNRIRSVFTPPTRTVEPGSLEAEYGGVLPGTVIATGESSIAHNFLQETSGLAPFAINGALSGIATAAQGVVAATAPMRQQTAYLPDQVAQQSETSIGQGLFEALSGTAFGVIGAKQGAKFGADLLTKLVSAFRVGAPAALAGAEEGAAGGAVVTPEFGGVGAIPGALIGGVVAAGSAIAFSNKLGTLAKSSIDEAQEGSTFGPERVGISIGTANPNGAIKDFVDALQHAAGALKDVGASLAGWNSISPSSPALAVELGQEQQRLGVAFTGIDTQAQRAMSNPLMYSANLKYEAGNISGLVNDAYAVAGTGDWLGAQALLAKANASPEELDKGYSIANTSRMVAEEAPEVVSRLSSAESSVQLGLAQGRGAGALGSGNGNPRIKEQIDAANSLDQRIIDSLKGVTGSEADATRLQHQASIDPRLAQYQSEVVMSGREMQIAQDVAGGGAIVSGAESGFTSTLYTGGTTASLQSANTNRAQAEQSQISLLLNASKQVIPPEQAAQLRAQAANEQAGLVAEQYQFGQSIKAYSTQEAGVGLARTQMGVSLAQMYGSPEEVSAKITESGSNIAETLTKLAEQMKNVTVLERPSLEKQYSDLQMQQASLSYQQIQNQFAGISISQTTGSAISGMADITSQVSGTSVTTQDAYLATYHQAQAAYSKADSILSNPNIDKGSEVYARALATKSGAASQMQGGIEGMGQVVFSPQQQQALTSAELSVNLLGLGYATRGSLAFSDQKLASVYGDMIKTT